MESLVTHLECRACCSTFPANRLANVCATCGQALFASYDLDRARDRLRPSLWAARATNLWRYFELLPVGRPESIVTLGEGWTPILELGSQATDDGFRVFVKDDGRNPTGSFKARGLSVAVSRARELGVRAGFVPTAGNAGVAFSAYAARAGIAARVYTPDATPETFRSACRSYGAEVISVPGSISDAGAFARSREAPTGGFDFSTMREPYRVEGKKTMAFEMFEQLGAEGLPDLIVYPTGGGTGLVGMGKAFRELQSLGWVDRIPRLVAVQPEGCAPIVRAFQNEATRAEPWADPATIAPGLCVPAPFASERILETIRASRGTAVTVTDREIVTAMGELSRRHGLGVSPEAAATYAALPPLHASRSIHSGDRVLLYLTGSGLPYQLPDLERAVGAWGSDPVFPSVESERHP